MESKLGILHAKVSWLENNVIMYEWSLPLSINLSMLTFPSEGMYTLRILQNEVYTSDILHPSNAKATFIQRSKPSKPCHVGIHWIAFTEYSQMSTHMPGFHSFFMFVCIILYWPHLSHRQHKGKLTSNHHLCMSLLHHFVLAKLD